MRRRPYSVIGYKTMQTKIQESVKKHFKPEFLNRLDGLVIFKPLDKASLHKVISLEIAKLQKRLAKKEIEIELDPSAAEYLVEKGYVPEMGARPLRRIIEQYVEDPLAEKLLQTPNQKQQFRISSKDGELHFVEKGAAVPPPDPVKTG